MNFRVWIEQGEENPQLPFATAHDQGVRFETGRPVTFTYMRMNSPAGNFGSTYQQDIEPAGRYMIHNEDPGDTGGWEVGTQVFSSPLVLKFNPVDDVSYDENSWKHALHKYYGGKKRKALSRAIRADGYDGIVTVGMGPYAKEIVDLTMF